MSEGKFVDFVGQRDVESLRQENEALKLEIAELKRRLQNLINAYHEECWGTYIECE